VRANQGIGPNVRRELTPLSSARRLAEDDELADGWTIADVNVGVDLGSQSLNQTTKARRHKKYFPFVSWCLGG
jgi:hypothetical protein